jgi:hypothetical protein
MNHVRGQVLYCEGVTAHDPHVRMARVFHTHAMGCTMLVGCNAA